NYSPVSDMEFDRFEDLSSDNIPPLPAISPFLSSDDDTTDSDTPPSPTRLSLILPLLPRDHLSYLVTARKRVRPFLVPQLAVGHPVDHSSSDYFSPDDSARDL
ncbi:hypothetical protein Tco_1291111, partial [Tanacetum coccineum]